jgi:hypothetical protein
LDTNLLLLLLLFRLVAKRRAFFEKYGVGAKNVPEEEKWTRELKMDLQKYADQARLSASFIMLKN